MAFDGTGEGVSLHGGGGVELDEKRHSGEVREARGELLASGTRAGSGARAARRGRPPPLLKAERRGVGAPGPVLGRDRGTRRRLLLATRRPRLLLLQEENEGETS